MKARFWLVLIFIMSGLFLRSLYYRDISNQGVQMLLPVSVRTLDASGKGTFRYHNLVPASFITSRTGVLVVSKQGTGTVKFVRMDHSDKPLRPNEHRLKYFLRHEGGFLIGNGHSKVSFASESYRFRYIKGGRTLLDNQKKITIRYAVVRVAPSGTAVLVGMADQNGMLLSSKKKL